MAYIEDLYKIYRGNQAGDGTGTPARTAAEGLNRNADLINNALEAINNRITTVQEDIYIDISEEILEVMSSIEGLETSLILAVKDGVISATEAANIGRYIENLNNDRSDIDSRFSVLYSSEYLDPNQKEDLSQAKISYDNKHSELVTFIQALVDQGQVSSAEEAELKQKFQEYRDEIKAFTQAYELAYNRIAEARIDAIKPGTRNILLDSKTAQFTEDGNILRFHFSAVEIRWDNTDIRWDNTEVRWDGGKPNVSSELLENDHIVSVDVVSDVSQAITLRLTDGMQGSSERVWELEAGRRTRVYVHLKAGWGNQTLDFSIEKHVADSNLEVSRPKLAEGNKSDNYSQAPEDVEKAIEKTRQEVIEANEAYAKAEAERAELEAKVWVDGKLTALEKMLLADATAKANAARRYAEAQDTHLQILTEAYADGKIDALESELIDLSEANLTAAQGYVDAQILLEQVRSDGYVDQEIATERQRAINDAQQKYDDAVAEAETLAGAARDAALQDAQNKYDAAISHANAEAALAQANAIADADGKITAEEQARIQALEDYEAAAQDYADAAQALAETNAAAYADGKITEEEAARIAEAEANLLEAKQHATSLADALDTRIDGQNTYIQQLAEDNLEAAKDYAEAQDTALQTAIQAYADGIVSDAEARAIAEAQAEAQAAKDYAEAQDALLDTAIRAYADGEITDAEARAIHEAELKVQAVRGEMETLRTDLEDEIDQVNSRIDTLETDTLAAIEDGILTQTEISNIKSQKNLLDKEKTDVDRRYQITYTNPHLEGTAKDELADAEGIYQTAYTALSDYYEDIFATEEIPAGDPVALLDAYRNALAEFSSAMDEALSAIAQKKADLAEGSAILHTNTRLNDEVIPAINDVQAAADALEFLTDEAFWDGKLDENEAKALQLHIEPLQTEKEDIYSKYAVVYTNELLKDPAKENLYQAYDAYDDVHTDLIAAIQALAVGEITPAKRQAVSDAFDTHRTALQSLTTAFEEAAKAIEYEHIDQIIIGTRNLILGEVEFSGNDTRTVELSGEAIRWDNSEIRWDNTEVRWDSGHPNLSTDNLVGQHAIGLDIIVPTQRTIRIEIRDTVAPFTIKAREHLVPAGRKTRIGAIGEGKEGNTGFVVTVLNAQGAEISNVKLEIGNKWTDYNESPEDVGDRINQARLNAQSAAEAYAKAEAERQALLVKVHADGKITQLEKRLLEHADAVANAARRYSQAEDAHLQILLEAYADGEISDLEENLIQLSNDNLDAAQAAATAAANAAQTAAEAYADGKITDAEAALMSYADNAASAAEAAAIAADTALQGVLEAYADGAVSAEEQARINALQAYADAAENYADAAANAAEIAAKAHADGEITDAEARAIADATAKMNEAKDHADQLFGDLQDQVDDVSANAQQALDVAQELSQDLGAFGTKVGDHSIITGAVEVGSPVGGGNAGISGIVDDGAKSVRFYSGSSYANRNTAPFRVLNDGSVIARLLHIISRISNSLAGLEIVDGTIIITDSNGVVRWRLGIDEEDELVFNFYDKTGEQKVHLSDKGWEFVGYVPESYSAANLFQLSTDSNPTDSTLRNAFVNRLRQELIMGEPGTLPNHDEFFTYRVELGGAKTEAYRYNAGNNLETVGNKQYEGFYYKTKNKLGDYVQDGWYCSGWGSIVYWGTVEDHTGNPQYHNGTFSGEFTAFQIVNGERVESTVRTISFGPVNATTLPEV